MEQSIFNQFYKSLDNLLEQVILLNGKQELEILIDDHLYWGLLADVQPTVNPYTMKDINYESYFYYKGIVIRNKSNTQISII